MPVIKHTITEDQRLQEAHFHMFFASFLVEAARSCQESLDGYFIGTFSTEWMFGCEIINLELLQQIATKHNLTMEYRKCQIDWTRSEMRWVVSYAPHRVQTG